MSYTDTENELTDDAAEILEFALDGGTLTALIGKDAAWTKTTPNRWGGFDITSPYQIVRVTNDDGQWTVTLLTGNGVERGRQTFTGCFASLHLVGMTVQGLL